MKFQQQSTDYFFSTTVLTLLAGWQEGQLACQNPASTITNNYFWQQACPRVMRLLNTTPEEKNLIHL